MQRKIALVRRSVMMMDLKFAIRVLLKQKGWTAVVVSSLALGIGANVALFTAVNSLLLQSLSVREPESLVRFRIVGDNDMANNTREYGFLGRTEDGRRLGATFPLDTFRAFQQANETLTGLFAASPLYRVNVVHDGNAGVGTGLAASGDYFDVLGVRAARGRLLGPDDDRPSAPPAAVISHAYWQRRFGLDETVVGRNVTVNGLSMTIVGVIERGYRGVRATGEQPADVHFSLAHYEPVTGEALASDPTFWWLMVMGRIEPGAEYSRVQGNLNGILQSTARSGLASHLESLTPEERSRARYQGRSSVPTLVVESGRRGVYDPSPDVRRDSTVLGGVVALLLLIVCANVANLLLSRAAARRPEIAIRQSMGASRGRLVRQLLLEGFLLSLVGGMLSLAVAHWTKRLLPHGQDAPFDAGTLAFVAALSAVAAIGFSLVPALQATRATGRPFADRSVTFARTPLSRGLLVLQVALSLTILTGAGLFLTTLENLRNVDVGFDPANVLLFRLDPGLSGYDEERVPAFYDGVRERVMSVPGVRSVSLSRFSFLTGARQTRSAYFPEGDDEGSVVHIMQVSPEFFDTLGLTLLGGRSFERRDEQDAPAVAILNASAATEYFAGDAVGERFGFSVEDRGEVEVVGVVKDTKYASVRDEAPPTFFLPLRRDAGTRMTFEVKTELEPRALLPSVRSAVREVDANVPLIDVTTQTEEIEERLAQERAFALLYSLFGGLAMLLASIGLFGLASYEIVRRTREIGVRMALGAHRKHIVQMVLGDTFRLVLVGVAMGVGATLLGGRLVSSLLFGVSPSDAKTLATAALVLFVAALAAGYFPARRAARTEPTVALQHDGT